MFEKVGDSDFVRGEHDVLRFWEERQIFARRRQLNAGKQTWSFLDGPMTANNPMGVHHAWGRTYKDALQRYWAMNGRDQRYQNGFDCQGLWVEVEVEKQLGLGAKSAIEEFGIDKFVWECKKRVLKYAAIQTEQSVRLGYWMEWDDPEELRRLASAIGTDEIVEFSPPKKPTDRIRGSAEQIVERLGNPEWGGSYFTFATENNETIWTFLKKCHERGKIYRGHDVMPWSGRGGSAYSQMEVADGRKLTVHRALFVRLPIIAKSRESRVESREPDEAQGSPSLGRSPTNEYLLIWTTTPWTLTSNVAAMVNPDLEYVQLKAKRDGSIYYFAKDNLEFQRLAKEFKEGFGRPEWSWPKDCPKLKTLAQIFKENGGYEIVNPDKPIFGRDMIGWRYSGPFDHLTAQTDEHLATFRDMYAASKLQKAKVAIKFKGDSAAELLASILDNCNSFILDLMTALGASAPPTLSVDEQILTVNDLAPPEVAGLFHRIVTATRILEQLDPVATEFHTKGEIATVFDTLRLAQSKNDIVGVSYLGKRLFQVALLAVYDGAIGWLDGSKSGKGCHRVINGGRDSKNSPIVVSGEGTGIVHCAPGCGDVDYKVGEEHHIVSIAPLGEDGRFLDGFGPFTGKNAVAPETVDLVIDELKKKDLLVAVEKYPHIYPFCWRTGDELVFRLVDEWFINMDWRDEIMDVTKQIRWLPDSIQGQERELEWLGNMRNWMISKKRYWGLALPIWINPDDPSDFDVIGSLAELKERAVEGWKDFHGHTPHKPWIDGVKIKSQTTGAVLSRVPDVGNPWLDAGIVPFSTMAYNSDPEFWRKWYPADLVSECFPGQFRNWFYSLLSMATMMDGTPPFRTLFGYRLVMNEAGKPMHKSDGTAIWFEEAAEQIGVDSMRWMYLQQNPAQDLRFGTRHPDQPVTLTTPTGPSDKTIDGAPTCLVTSGPADDVRRQVLIPLWNSYAFFVNYARLDGFDPSLPAVPVQDRPEIDRWILSNLQALISGMRQSIENYDFQNACSLAATFIDDLSNWYIRRNRRRFWRSREQKPTDRNPWVSSESDKLAAYQTLYDVLVTLTKLLAPFVPFVSERMYRNLVESRESRVESQKEASSSGTQPESVHLCDYPVADASLLDTALNERMALAQLVVKLGHKLRDAADQRVRQPLPELRVATSDESKKEAITQLVDIIADELNVKQVTPRNSLRDIVTYVYRANLKTLGPRFGKQLQAVKVAIETGPSGLMDPLRFGAIDKVTLNLPDGTPVEITAEDFTVSTEQAAEWHCTDERGVQVALSSHLTPALLREGIARDFVRQVQQLRKDADLEIEQRIRVTYHTTDADVQAALTEWSEYIRNETLCDALTPSANIDGAKAATVGSAEIALRLDVVT